MDKNQAEYDILKMLVGTLCFAILMGIVGVAFGKVDVQFVEGLITGGLIALITNIFKDLSNKNTGEEPTKIVEVKNVGQSQTGN